MAPTPFERATFEAKLHEIKMTASGDFRVIILVPATDDSEAVKLRQAYACALRVTVEKQSYG